MKARIYQEQPSATQSGKATKRWVLQQLGCSDTHTDSLMGWNANNNHLKPILYFDTLSECEAYANEQKLDFEIIKPSTQHSTPKSYSDNFK